MLAWDRSHDWILQRCPRSLTRITIHFSQKSPTVTELAALRRCFPEFREMPPAMLRARLGDSGMLSLVEMSTREARPLVQAARKEGLRVVDEGRSYVSYLPIDRTTGCALLIEDEAEMQAVAEAISRRSRLTVESIKHRSAE